MIGDGTGFRKHREFTRQYHCAGVRIHSFAHIAVAKLVIIMNYLNIRPRTTPIVSM